MFEIKLLRVGGCTPISIATIPHISTLKNLSDLYLGSIAYSSLSRVSNFMKLYKINVYYYIIILNQ